MELKKRRAARKRSDRLRSAARRCGASAAWTRCTTRGQRCPQSPRRSASAGAAQRGRLARRLLAAYLRDSHAHGSACPDVGHRRGIPVPRPPARSAADRVAPAARSRGQRRGARSARRGTALARAALRAARDVGAARARPSVVGGRAGLRRARPRPTLGAALARRRARARRARRATARAAARSATGRSGRCTRSRAATTGARRSWSRSITAWSTVCRACGCSTRFSTRRPMSPTRFRCRCPGDARPGPATSCAARSATACAGSSAPPPRFGDALRRPTQARAAVRGLLDAAWSSVQLATGEIPEDALERSARRAPPALLHEPAARADPRRSEGARATVNDVVLCGLAGGLHRYLRGHRRAARTRSS